MYNNKSIFGQLEYIDERGFTKKAKRRINNNIGLAKVNNETADLLQEYDIKLVANPSTIISDTKIKNLKKFIDHSKRLWKEIKYPFCDNALIRTDMWDRKIALNRPTFLTEIEKTDEMVKKIFDHWKHKNFPQQILIHPQASKARKKKQMIFAQIYYSQNVLIGQFGNGGIELARFITDADNQFQVKLNSALKIKQYNGKFNNYINKKTLTRLMLSFKLVLPLFYEFIIPLTLRYKDISFEFHVLEHDNTLYLNYCDFDIG